MGKLCAILLLLAVASVSLISARQWDATSCPVKFFGREFNFFTASKEWPTSEICFKNSKASKSSNCLILNLKADNWDITKDDTVSKPVCRYELKAWSNVYSPTQVMTINSIFSKSIVIRPISAGDLQDYHQITMNELVNLGVIPTRHNYLKVRLQSDGTSSNVTVETLSDYSAENIVVSGIVSNSSVGKWFLKANRTNQIITSHGCKEPNSSGLVAVEAIKVDQKTCVRSTCNSSLFLSTTECGEDEVCNRDSSCVLFPVCTVTGSTIMDFHANNRDVPTRCAYTLINSTFSLLAVFRERRRQDVSFVDRLELSISGDTIVLEQGGRVLVNGQMVTLNATATKHGVVQLSNDKSGVSAKLPNRVTIFFDGNTAHVAGAFPESVSGLCGRPYDSSYWTKLDDWKSASSDTGCETKHNDTSGAVNCTLTAQSCNLLKEEPFTACHDLISTYFYVISCQATLCKYPAVDGLKCQFLEAYAKACRLKNKTINLEDWRSKASCPAVPQALCQDPYCTADEFCGEVRGGTDCLCRASFAAKYKSSKTLGEVAVCTDNSATVSLFGCLLKEQGIDYSMLHLKDQTCKGKIDSNTHVVTFSFNTSSTCGADVMMNNSQVIFKNTIMMGNNSKDIITRRDQVAIDFSCIYKKPTMSNSVFLKIKDSSVVQKIQSGKWNYTLTLNTYTDSSLQNVITANTQVKLNQKIWVELKTEGLDDTQVAVVIDSCWATNVQSHNAALRYDLIKNKCPDDKTVGLQRNGGGTSNSFSFNMFEFAGKNSEVYLHCKLELCLKNSNSCVPTCNGKGRRKRSSFRSEFADKNPALITMAWTN